MRHSAKEATHAETEREAINGLLPASQERSRAFISYHMAQGDWTETAVGQANHEARATGQRRRRCAVHCRRPRLVRDGSSSRLPLWWWWCGRAGGRGGRPWQTRNMSGAHGGERVRRGGGRLGEPEPCVACGDRERAGGIGMVNRHMPAGPGGDVMATRFDFAQGLRRAAPRRRIRKGHDDIFSSAPFSVPCAHHAQLVETTSRCGNRWTGSPRSACPCSSSLETHRKPKTCGAGQELAGNEQNYPIRHARTSAGGRSGCRMSLVTGSHNGAEQSRISPALHVATPCQQLRPESSYAHTSINPFWNQGETHPNHGEGSLATPVHLPQTAKEAGEGS